MRFRQRALAGVLLAAATVAQAQSAPPGGLDEFRVKRETVFEFTRKPAVTRDGDAFTIAFTVKAACDATVAIEDDRGRILRHLASGVLGANAPEPFQKNSLQQTIAWDGKDDRGNYLDRPNAVVRVSIGLTPQFERTLFWSPHKRLTGGKAIDADALRICARPEGVYVSDGTGVDSLRLFDHDGNYVRTVYPFPADKLKQAKGLNRTTLPQDGQPLPLGSGMMHATMLTAGSSADPENKYGFAAQFLAVGGSQVALGFRKLNRLATDGSLTAPLEGPALAHEVVIGKEDMWAGGKKIQAGPRSAAFSPDGKKLYLSGYGWSGILGRAHEWLSGVTVMDVAANDPPRLFAGSMKQGDHGAADGTFKWAVSLAADSQGRVYVADHLNNRIQVFTPDGTFIKAIATDRPTFVGVHHKTGQIYVLSWRLGSDDPISPPVKTPKYTRFGTLDDPKVLASCPLTALKEYDAGHGGSSRIIGGGMQYVASLDSWADAPTLWLATGKGEPIALLAEKDGKLETRRDFGTDIARTVVRATPPIIQRQRLYVNPADGKLYVAEGDSGVMKSCRQLVEIDPDSGRARLVDLPFDAEDLCIDLDGKFYLRTDLVVARYDPAGWREIPWDYGEDRKGVAFGSSSGDMKATDLVAGLPLPGVGRPAFWHLGGMAISPKGHLAVSCYNTASKSVVIDGTRPVSADTDLKRGTKNVTLPRSYTPPAYPGRDVDWQTHIWDQHGKLIVRDAAPGLAKTDGIGIDKDDNLYVMSSGSRMLGGKPYPVETAGTLMKIRPGKTKLLRTGKDVPVPLEGDAIPKRPADLLFPHLGQVWVENPEWFYGGVGLNNMACICWNARPALDLFARSFAPEINNHSVAVLDSNGNLILRVGRYGNIDDGVPLTKAGGPPDPRSIGGDEVSLMFGAYLATQSDRRLFIADAGNSRIVSVRLGYHAEEKLPVKDVPDNKK